MGISFGKRKVKIKLLGQTETIEEKPKVPVPIYQPETVSKAKTKVNRTLKEALRDISDISANKLHLSDFTAYLCYYSDNRYQFSKVTGGSVLDEITLERYWSIAEPTVFRRATGLSEAEEYRSRFVVLFDYDGKQYIFLWSSILYEAFKEETINQLKALLNEMRDKQ